ncbi:dehydrogenase [Rhodoplanes sp. Z2-YC6860]|uniref:dehydrogenase n=1 Tax=Rhodoplanes sp. Z2-YC6860 TaxID=674703 RepID=UPI00078D4E0F|nr:dehydrogenase [Rhodoplanes sp. Z2-YC6860]AMN41424.1 Threonine dehydrogenase [Rhodoplanes sp. Z2-YC6860]
MSGQEEIAEALWYVGPGRAEIREERLKPLTDGKVRVRALYSALSRGTEALIAAGRVPVSEYQRMRGPFMAGNFPFPVKYGYQTVGRVEAGPDDLIGRNVFVLYPHQTRFDVPADAVVPVPQEIPLSRAVMAANMETALNATWDASPGPYGRIAVVGGGVVGALVAFICARIDGAEVTLIDIDRSREELAASLGVAFATPDAAPTECDYVFHTSASAEGLTTALNIAAEEATIIELSWYGSGIVAVPLGGAFHSRRLRLISSQVGKVAPSHRATYSYRERLEAAITLTAHPHLDALLTPAVSFRELPTALPDILKARSGVLCQLISYS